MGIKRRLLLGGMMGLTVAMITMASGCQTTPAGFGGMTLPSGHYLEHYPQYFPPDPPFTLQREIDSMQDPDALLRPSPATSAPGPLPAPAIPALPSPAGVGLPR